MNSRVKRCLAAVNKNRVDALLFSRSTDIKYLTGQDLESGYLVLTCSGSMLYFTNPLYADAAARFKGWKVFSRRSSDADIFSEVLADQKISSLGVAASSLSHHEYKDLLEKISRRSIRYTEIVNPLVDIRMIKEPAEIKAIRQAVGITTQALDYAREVLSDTATEKSLAIEIDRFLRLKGDNATAFSTIVAAGPNSAFPHHTPTAQIIGKNPFITDLGARCYGYCADLTRISFSGKMPALFVKIYDIVKRLRSWAFARSAGSMQGC